MILTGKFIIMTLVYYFTMGGLDETDLPNEMRDSMKKKLLALICVMALFVGAAIMAVPRAEAAENSFQVGFARVDINPYIDPTLTGDALVATSNIMQLPLRGSGDVWNRLSTKGLMDDNGDGVVTSDDGLKATCMAVTDANGKTVMFITVDLIGGTMISKVNKAVVERVTAAIEAGEITNVDLAKEAIYYGGTHTHSAPDTTVYVAAGKTGTNSAGIDLSVPNEQLGIWIDRTIENICDAAIAALKDRSAATVTKDQLAVSDATSEAVKGKTLTSTRHYVNGEDGSIAGDNFNSRGDNPTQITDANDNIYLMKFTFEDSSKLPIILTSFRGHPSLNNSDSYAGADNNHISSDYINAYRTALEFGTNVTIDKETGVGYVESWTHGTTQKYRVLYFNGTGGNTNPRGYEILRDENGNALTSTSGSVIRAYSWIDQSASKGGNTRANSVGNVLAVLAQECLTDGKNESNVDYGEIKTVQKKYVADRKTVGINSLSHNAGVAYQESDKLYDAAYSAYTTANTKFNAYKSAKSTYDNASSWLKWMYKSDMDNALAAYNTANETLKPLNAAYVEYMDAHFTNASTQASTTLVGSTYGPTKPLQTHPMIYKEGDETFAIGSRFHASNLVSMWNSKLDIPKTGDIDVTLNAFMLGEDLAFVVVPGEPFDYYFKEYGVYTPENNLWNILDDSTYGKPIVLGYTNGALGYFPNYEAYFYNEGRTDKSIGSYETQNNTKEAGHGEEMIYQLDSMLAALNAQDRVAYCAHCKQDVTWTPYMLQKTISAGHYYLAADYAGAQVRIADNEQVCFDLNGYTFYGTEARAFYLEANTTTQLSIMDSSKAQTGVVKALGGSIGAPNGYGGKTVIVGKKTTLNLYSGTLTGAEKGNHSVYAGGVLFIRGTFNMYGGKVIGSTVSSFTGQYLKSGVPTDMERAASGGAIESSGTLNLYGGQIISGSGQRITGTVIGSEELGHAYSQTVEPVEIKDPGVTVLTGGAVNLGGDCSVEDIYFTDGISGKLTLHGIYTGAMEITYPEETSVGAGTSVGIAVADSLGNPANTSSSAITVKGCEGLYAAVKGSQLILSEAPYNYAYCEACDLEVQWKPMTDATLDQTANTKGMKPGHYVLAEDTETTQKQLNVNGDNAGTFCFDIAGHTFTGASRAFYVYDGAVLNLVDSVGGGILEGKSSTATGGGILYIQDSGVINLYGGTVRHNDANNDYVASGGCVRCNGGTLNMYGGTLKGLKVSSVGGVAYVGARTSNGVTNYGQFNIYGGEITAGTAGDVGDCIYVNNAKCKVTVAENVNVPDVYVSVDPADVLVVDTTDAPFTGSVQLTCKTQPETGATLGTVKGTNSITTGAVTLSGSSLPVIVVDGKLTTKLELKSFHLYDESGMYATFDTFAEALAAYTYDETRGNYIQLTKDVSKPSINKTVVVDLNGFYLSYPTVEDGVILYAMDSQTNDFTVEDEMAYGMVYHPTVLGTAQVQGLPLESDAAGDGYLMIDEGSGYSFHRVSLGIQAMSLRPGAAGVYYSCNFMGDEIVAENVKSFGIALSAWIEPDAMTLDEMCLYTENTQFAPGASGNASHGVLLSGIMKTTNTAEKNRQNGEIAVYGRAYIETEDGYTFGLSVSRSLKDQLEDINGIWDQLSDVQKSSVAEFVTTYFDAVKDWDISSIISNA